MSDGKKTIQEALAEVQKNAELKRVEEAKKVWGEALQIDEAMAAAPPPSFDPPAISGQRMAGTVKRSGTATGRFVQPQRVTASAPGKTPSRALVPTGGRTPVASSSSTPSAPSGSKGLTTTGSTSVAPSAASAPKTGFAGKLPTEHGFRAHSIPGSGGAASAGDKVRNVTKYLGPIGAAAIGGAQASNILGGLATGTETGRNIGKAIGELPGAQTAANLMRKAGEAIGVRPKAEPETPTPAPSAAPKAETTQKVAAPTPAPSAAPKVATSTSTATAAPKAAPSTAKEVPTIKAPSAAPKTADTSATTTKGGYFTKSPNVSKGDYTIKSGDTLSDIAKSHGTSVGAIQSMNKGLTDVNKIAAGGSLNLPTSTKAAPTAAPKADTTPAPAPAKSETPIKDFVRDTMQGKVETPIMDLIKGKSREESESGKKKKMSEDTNPLIAAFLDLQAKNPENMFVEAKKLSKKQDEKLDVVDDDKIDAKDLAALRAGKKKVDEAAGDETAKRETSMNVTVDNKPSTPAKTAAATSGPSDSDKKALDSKIKTIAKEEVTFSQAEIDHINSFFLEASVAPNRPEVAREADSTSEGMSQNDVTGTHTESGKKKIKEEVEQIEEGRPKKNPTPETTERDPRQHIQVAAGRAAAGNVIDFHHNDGSKSKITPGMGRRITSHLNSLKPADRQAAVNKMHDSAEGLKV